MLALVDREGAVRRGARDDAEAARQDHRESNPAIEANVRRLIKQQSPAAIRGAILRMMHRARLDAAAAK